MGQIINAKIVQQRLSFKPVADELTEWLDIIQNKWEYEIINVIETKVNKIPDCSDQGFIILFKEVPDNGQVD